jgi:elongation factor G
MGLINQRRGIIQGSQEEGGIMSVIESQVPLSEMFGFSTILRSATQGKAQFTMEFSIYKQVPQSVAEEIVRKKLEEKPKK